MKRVNKSIVYIGLFGVLLVAFSSCEDYLDREPNTTVSSKDAFKNFDNFQGFVEEVITKIPDKEKCSWCPSWNWGEDEVFNPQGDDRMTHQVDLGNFRAWYSPSENLGNFLLTSPDAVQHGQTKGRSLWGNAWYCIRKMNMGIEHIDDMIAGTDEEKRRILGQCYFYRAWWHFELMEFFGGLPYIDTVLDPNNIPHLPRLTFQECAKRCIDDFRKAAELLPICWDSTEVKGQDEKNQMRVNKIVALCYKGKCELWAGSPLMEHDAQLGALSNGLTYQYNKEFCDSAAETFGTVLKLIETKANKQYQLANFDYTNIYDHVRVDEEDVTPGYDPLWCYSDLFYTYNQSTKNPGGNEAIMRTPSNNEDGNSNWACSKVWGPKMKNLVSHDKIIHQPTANYVELYGMANGLPIKDENGNYANGFDPTHPWKDRDPRFYHDIVFDGFKYLLAAVKETDERKDYVYCELFTNGNMRPVDDGSRTGYFIQKLVPHQCNEIDQWLYGDMHVLLSYMRLADVYLMYAEACAAIGGHSYKAKSYGKTAEQAINVVRTRCHAGPVGGTGKNMNKKYVTDDKLFMDEIRRERAVELSFEGFRYNDLQRWLLLTEYPYNTKFSCEFTRGESKEFYEFKNGEDPKDAKVNGYHLEPILTRNFGTKHYWFPFPDADVYIYKDFAQNPGW